MLRNSSMYNGSVKDPNLLATQDLGINYFSLSDTYVNCALTVHLRICEENLHIFHECATAQQTHSRLDAALQM